MNNLYDLIRISGGHLAAVLRTLFGNRERDSAAILCYHGVLPQPRGGELSPFHCTPETFRAQLEGLANYGYRFVALRELLDALASGRTEPGALAVTFDDGYANVLYHAYPVLKSLQIPATVFICTAFVDCPGPLPFDSWEQSGRGRISPEEFRHLSEEECRQLTADGLVDLGSHTHTHRDFRERPEALFHDVAASCRWLLARFGCSQVPFAFPFGRKYSGHWTEELVAAAQRAGVCCALSTECEPVRAGTSPFHLGRFLVYRWDSAATLAGKLAGYYAWIPRWQNRVARCFYWGRRRLPRTTPLAVRPKVGPRCEKRGTTAAERSVD